MQYYIATISHHEANIIHNRLRLCSEKLLFFICFKEMTIPIDKEETSNPQATPRHYTSGAKVCVHMCVALSVKLCALFTLGDAS